MTLPRMFKDDSPDPELDNYNPRLAQIYIIQEVATKFFLSEIDNAIAEGCPNMHVTKRLRPIHFAAYANSVDYVAGLAQAGAKLDAIDEVGYTPVHYCTIFGCSEALEELIRLGACINFEQGNLPASKRTNAEQPIRLAMECNQPKCAEVLLKHGAKPDTQYYRGHEINLVALEFVECLEVLLKHGAKPDVYNQLGQTPLMKACKECNIAAVKLLLQYGASVNLRFQRFDKKSVLFYAIFGGNPQVVQLLLDAGVDIDTPVDSTTSPLSMTVHCNNTPENKYQIGAMLLRHGADVNGVDQTFHCTALSTACGRKNVKADLVRLLLENGADVNFTNGISPSPLVKYLEANRDFYDFDVVHTLLKYGATVRLTSSTCDPFCVLKGLHNVQDDDRILELLFLAMEDFDSGAAFRPDPAGRTFGPRVRHRLHSASSRPSRLKNSVRLFLRRALQSKDGLLPDRLNELPLPNILKMFILFEAL